MSLCVIVAKRRKNEKNERKEEEEGGEVRHVMMSNEEFNQA